MWRLNNHLVVWRKGKGVIMAQFQVSINSAPTIIGLPPYTERDNTDVIWQDMSTGATSA
ncbi:hypothetical protein H8356DRAFT_1343868 [Neocallimastix lanati (nom. inval.)]|nr:hypothetical protein H8356DRAFT_1346405 [Neocallimastix sp. JGI-2020a]KAG4094874.1 hypothetical protein H8356DRAFT_1343868 [Neocallimastix sp. JGI-2020a]